MVGWTRGLEAETDMINFESQQLPEVSTIGLLRPGCERRTVRERRGQGGTFLRWGGRLRTSCSLSCKLLYKPGATIARRIGARSFWSSEVDSGL